MPDGEFQIRSAVRVNTPAFVALAGPSGSGKTRSALELATGLAGDKGKILLADTEGNRALHYADLYRFDHVEFRPPYTPERCAELIDLAESKGYTALVVDSGSDEYEGEGGLQEIRDQTNDEFWAKTKARHKHHLVNRIRRARLHVIFCLRCEERVKISKVQGRTVVETLGWQPICEKRFLYEMQSSFRFDPEAPGVPVPIKLYDIHAQFFPPDQKITREAGRRLAEWAAGGAAVPAAAVSSVPMSDNPAADAAFLAGAEAKADQGTDAFRAWWKTLSKGNRDLLRDSLGKLQERAVKSDEGAEMGEPAGPEAKFRDEPGEDPFGLPPLTEPASPDRAEGAAGEALPPGSSDPPPASPAASPIAIVKPHGGAPDWPATRSRLVGAFYDLATIPDCDAFRLRNSATINALRDFAPDEFEIWDTLAATHERVRRGLHGEEG